MSSYSCVAWGARVAMPKIVGFGYCENGPEVLSNVKTLWAALPISDGVVFSRGGGDRSISGGGARNRVAAQLSS